MTPPLAHAVAPGRGGLAVRAAVIAYVVVLIIAPLGTLAYGGLASGLGTLWSALTSPAAIDALVLTLWTAALMAAVNAVLGTVTAWVLVRYNFPGCRFLSALVDISFAIPTLVAGFMLVLVFGPREPIGSWLDARGIDVLFAPPAIVLALLFITVPFVVRAVEPVLMEIDPDEEEAAHTLGAGNWTTFRRVILPVILPAIVLGTLQAFARALAEFGSIVVVSGNIPHRTLTAPVLIFGEVESGRLDVAAAVSLVLLALAFALSLSVRWMRAAARSRNV